MKLRRSQYLGYALGDAANNLTFSMVSAFLLIYYTDVAGISAGTAGTLFLVVRVWGGVTDLVAGRVVDGTNTRWGKFRPYLVVASVPLLALLVMLFAIPSGMSDGAKVAWAYLSYALFSLAYSFVNIPFGSLSAAMTQDPDERAKLSTSRSIAASVTILVIAVAVSPQIASGGDLQRSLTITTIVFAIVGYLFYLYCFATSRETVHRSADKTGLRETAAMLRRNRPLLILCAATMLYLTGMFSTQTVGVFYARDVLGNADLYIVLTVVQTVGMVVASALVPMAVKALGKKRAYILFAVIAAAAGIALTFAPDSIPALGIVFFGLMGFGLGVVNTLIFALQPDTVDYGDWKTGIRAEGANYSILSFTRKVGQGVGGAAAAYTIGVGGYISGADTQTGAALTSIKVAAGLVPAMAMLAAAAVMLAYPLTEKVVRRMVSEIAMRRAEADSALAPPHATAGATP
jgi:glucuronide carrier protein